MYRGDVSLMVSVRDASDLVLLQQGIPGIPK
jgi:hypothetical protein